MGGSGELELIRGIRKRAGKSLGSLRLGIGDDCAVLRPPAGHDVVVTTDFSLERRHFRWDWHPSASVGHRCLARGLSDLAAMGARPMGAFLSLALPIGTLQNKTSQRFIDGFFDGLMTLAKSTGTPLAGGDTASAPGAEMLADIVLLGSVPRGKELRRSGARVGDAIYVTGALGGAAAELELLSKRPRRFARAAAGDDHPHLFPVPRLVQGERLRGVASAAMDLSDGLSTDLRHLCDESGVGAVIDAEALPLHPLLAGMPSAEAEELALHGGEDYELLFTARPSMKVPRHIGGVAIMRIGSVTRGSDVMLRRGAREIPLVPAGWEHRL